jgi:hypothetical protein
MITPRLWLRLQGEKNLQNFAGERFHPAEA